MIWPNRFLAWRRSKTPPAWISLGVIHYFQADERTARTAIDLGFYISLARPLLRLSHLQVLAASLPLENIVLETDSAPQPFKPELPISSCLDPSNAPSSTRAIVVSLTDAVNHPIKLTKPSLGVVS